VQPGQQTRLDVISCGEGRPASLEFAPQESLRDDGSVQPLQGVAERIREPARAQPRIDLGDVERHRARHLRGAARELAQGGVRLRIEARQAQAGNGCAGFQTLVTTPQLLAHLYQRAGPEQAS